MTDRELLELAAKAAGDIPNAIIGAEPGYYWCGDTCRQQWNPLADDGDALRLKVKLDLDLFTVQQDVFYIRAICIVTGCYAQEQQGIDDYAATRRAIVRAAAEIGRGVGGSNG